ncbi:hypothetical protein ASPCAL00502 [Aspergillus calidoustus]|uniref:protein S-acyltransferase n=1 Tax=Aspergillus calidoustus TaxID=454130 RepID=A0A0U5FRQ9_ASPCI|nr:hypothetical protein ASPCAL00502 [Aspergillus calidoustus]
MEQYLNICTWTECGVPCPVDRPYELTTDTGGPLGNGWCPATLFELILYGSLPVRTLCCPQKDAFMNCQGLLFARAVSLTLSANQTLPGHLLKRGTMLLLFDFTFDYNIPLFHFLEKLRYNTRPLFHEIDLEMTTEVQMLNDYADIESQDEDGRTPLSRAAKDGREEVVKLLLQQNANIEARDNDGQFPIILAAKNGHEQVVKLLLVQNANIEVKDNDGWTPLSWAAENGHEGVIKLLLEKDADVESKDITGWNPLLWAAEKGNEGVIKLLLEKDANIETKDKNGQTPLSWAARNGHEGTVKLLLQRNANTGSKDNDGWTPLVWATKEGHEGVAKLLLKKNMDV